MYRQLYKCRVLCIMDAEYSSYSFENLGGKAMRRYTSLLLVAFMLVLLIATISDNLAGHADRTRRDRPLQSITIYTTLPPEHVSMLADGYEKAKRVQVNFVPVSSEEVLQKLRQDAVIGREKADLVLADQRTLEKAAADGSLQPYLSESTDSVSAAFKDAAGEWTGVWYDPVVFCANRDYVRAVPRVPNTWMELATMSGVRVGITDFLAADASANLFFSMMSQFGDTATYDILRGIQPKVVQYSKYLSTPVRMAGMGEVDLSVAVQSEALRYIHQGYPLQVIYPEDGTAYTLTGAGIVEGAKNEAQAEDFVEWLLSDEAQLVLQSREFFFVPLNPVTIAYKSFPGKDVVLFSRPQEFSPSARHDLLDRWVKEVRLQ